MMQRQRGFTLIELAVTVVIVGILATAAFPLAELSIKRHKEGELRDALREIRTALDAYYDAAKIGRIARAADETGYPKRLEDLTAGVDDLRSPAHEKIYFLRRLPRDPFFEDTGVPAAATWGKRSYASPPDMPSEGKDVFDIYSLSLESGLNGMPYRDW